MVSSRWKKVPTDKREREDRPVGRTTGMADAFREIPRVNIVNFTIFCGFQVCTKVCARVILVPLKPSAHAGFHES